MLLSDPEATVTTFLFPECKWILYEVIEGNWWHYFLYLGYQQHINEKHSYHTDQHIWIERSQAVSCLSRYALHFCILCEVAGTKLLKLLIPSISLPSPSIRDKLFRNTKSLDLFILFCSSLFILMYSHSEQWPVSYYFILTVSICTFEANDGFNV